MTADTITIATALLLILLLSSLSPQRQAAVAVAVAVAGAGGVVRASPSPPSSATNNNLRGGGGGGSWARDDIENENNDRRRRRRRRRDRRRGLYAWQTATPYADPDALCGSGATGYRATRDCSGFVYCLNGYLMVSGGIIHVQIYYGIPLFLSPSFFISAKKKEKLNIYTHRVNIPSLSPHPLPPHFARTKNDIPLPPSPENKKN
jgi:hypothetical protein